MRRCACNAVWWALLIALPRVGGGTVAPPQRGFEQNVGQYGGDALFALEDLVFYRDKVQLTPQLPVQFADANPRVTVAGKDPLPVPLNLYFGADPRRWRENVPHFHTVNYAQVYPGIDIDWSSRAGAPMVRITVAAGGNPQQILFRLLADQKLGWIVTGGSVIVWSPGYWTFDGLVAYQPAGASRSPVAVRFVQVDESSFRPVVDTYNPALPLVVEFGQAYTAALYSSLFGFGSDNSAFLAGGVDNHCFATRVSPTGDPLFLTLFDALGISWLVPGQNGEFTVAGNWFSSYYRGVPPTTADAPRPVAQSGGSEGWVARFDAGGKLQAATFTGDAVRALSVDPEGAVYFASSDSIFKWVPGARQFSFTAPVRAVSSLFTKSSGSLAFAANRAPDQPTTRGALRDHYEGPWDAYVGTLDPSTGKLQMATYVAVTGADPRQFSPRSVVSLAPGGTLWIASDFSFYEGAAHTLAAVSGDGSRVLHIESVPEFPWLSFDSRGNVSMAISTYWPNLPTLADAPRRAGCVPYYNLYVRTMAPDGTVLDATYLPGAGQILTFDGLDRLFVLGRPPYYNADPEHVDTSRPGKPDVACVVHGASHEPRTSVNPGGLYTLLGNGLGPLEQVNASVGSDLPLKLAGVEVLLNGVPAPLLSVQQGLITFYVPEATPYVPATLEVRVGGSVAATTKLYISNVLDFPLLAADGSGRGLAAALNQDGTCNGPNNPAKWGSAVALFGMGPLPSPLKVSLGNIEYAGPAPGTVPGVKQIDIRLSARGVSQGWLPVRVGPASATGPATVIYVAP